MTTTEHVLELDETALERLAGLMAMEVARGDLIALSGELGAGKTTFARALIRACLADLEAEVPSPTFSLVQDYDTVRGSITHCDLYRIDGADGVIELGLEEALARGALLVEWPERAEPLLAAERLDLRLEEIAGGARRRVTLSGQGSWPRRLDRLIAIRDFIDKSGWGGAVAGPIPGDASARRYLRLNETGRRALLMDAPRMPDGPPVRDGKPYSRIAHLAEDVKPFVAVARHLGACGLSAPAILAADLEQGLLLIEDLGDKVFGAEVAAGRDQKAMWRAGVEALLALHRAPLSRQLPVGNGSTHSVPAFDRGVMQIEVELLTDWYVPALTGAPLAANELDAFREGWQPVFERLMVQPPALILRDFHSPNLIWLRERSNERKAGVIDFQDALIGPAAYDLVSLLQDARLDVPEGLERELLDFYCERAQQTQPGFQEADFRWAYAALGAQRNTKILGIFARLARRDGKPRYLAHIPRIWRYLERDLAHPELTSLAAWYDRCLPATWRSRPLSA